MLTPARIAVAVGAAVVLVVTALVVLIDDPVTRPTRLRERVILSDQISSVLTGATVSIGSDPSLIEVAVGGETVCTFESRRPRLHFATTGGDTWIVNVRRISTESRTADVRVDRVPESGEPAGCRTETRADGG